MICLVLVLLCLSSFSSLFSFIYLFIYIFYFMFLLWLHVLCYILFLYLPGAKSGGNMCTMGLANGIRFKILNHDP